MFHPGLRVPSVHCDQNEVVTKYNQISQHPLHELLQHKKPSGIYAIELVKLIDKMDKFLLAESFSIQEPN